MPSPLLRRALPALLLLGLLPSGLLAQEPAAQDPEPAKADEPKKLSDLTPEERRALRERRRLVRERAEKAEKAEKEGEETLPKTPRVSFELSFPAARGGGSAAGTAGDIRYEGSEVAVLSGGVEIDYQDVTIQAAEMEVDLANKIVTATGHVILDQGPRRLAGVAMRFDLDDKTGTLTQGSAYVEPDIYFWGSEIEKTGENTFSVHDGVFTSCEDDVPDWSFRLRRADITVDGYAKIHNLSMRVKKAPIFYWPYMIWPVKEDRTSGFLVPNIGWSERRGAYLGLAYYQVLGPSYDTTFYADLFSKDYYGFGNEFRYRPSEGTQGIFSGYVIRDPEALDDEDEWRWKLDLDHETTDLPWGLRGVVTVSEFSDFDFFQDFERDIDRNTVRSLESRGFLSGSWGPHSLNILLNRRQTFFPNNDNNTVTLQRLPELEYRLRPRRLGSLPLFLKMETSLAGLDVERSVNQDGSYGRFDLFPQLELPLRLAPWMSVKLSGGYRYTWWGESLDRTTNSFTGESLSRGLPFAGAEIVGPSFSRIFEKQGGKIEKLKHVIEPRFDYTFFGEDTDELLETPLFDEIDRIGEANLGRIALVNRVLAKPRPRQKAAEKEAEEDEAEEEIAGDDSGETAEDEGTDDQVPSEAIAQEISASAREILSVELFRFYSFDDEVPLQQSTATGETDAFGPVSALLRYNPSGRTSLTARADYNTLFSEVQATSLSGELGLGASSLGLSWVTRKNPETGQTRSDQARLNANLDLVPKKLKLQAFVVYDLDTSELLQQRYILGYTSQCYSFRLEWREGRRGALEDDQEIRFSLTLKNVGTFLDLTN